MRSPSPAELDLYAHAQAAAVHAYVPYSRFAVGAALLPEGGGEPVTAVNVENASYGLTVCAERNAVFAAVAAGHRRFDAVAVYAEADSVPSLRRMPAGAGGVCADDARWSSAAAARSWRWGWTSSCPSSSGCDRARVPIGPRGAGRAAERGQVDAGEPPGRRARRRRLGPAADDPPAGARSRQPRGLPARDGRPARVPEALRPADRADAAVGERDPRRCRRDGAHARRARTGRPGRPLHRRPCARRGRAAVRRRGQQDRRDRPRPHRPDPATR